MIDPVDQLGISLFTGPHPCKVDEVIARITELVVLLSKQKGYGAGPTMLHSSKGVPILAWALLLGDEPLLDANCQSWVCRR